MAEKAAANNENLIIGNIDGTSKSIPAKELLKRLLNKLQLFIMQKISVISIPVTDQQRA